MVKPTKLSHRLPAVAVSKGSVLNLSRPMSPRHKTRESVLRPQQVSTPSFLTLAAYNYQGLLHDNGAIDQMRAAKLQLTKNRYVEAVKNGKLLSGNQLAHRNSVSDLNFLKGGQSQFTNAQQAMINPTQVAVRARIRNTDKRTQTITASFKRGASVEHLRLNIGKLNTKTSGNMSKMLGNQGKQKLPNLKTTTLDRNGDKIPFNRYLNNRTRMTDSTDAFVVGNKENLNTNFDNDESESVNQKSAMELPKVETHVSFRNRSPASQKFSVYKDRLEIGRLLTKPEQVKFNVIKKQLSMVKVAKPFTDVDQWNMEYLQYSKN